MHNPFNQVKAYLFMSLLIIMGLIIVTSCTPAIAQSNVSIQDHYKNVIMQLPKRVEVCYDKTVSGDKTGDALMGAIIGGILGNQNSTVGGKQMSCRTMTRYNESMQTIYSHSTITFIYEGKQYSVNFKK